jgi:hypothetical protein
MSALDYAILVWPSEVNLKDVATTDTAPRSWIQLAKAGSFVSNRYGKFAITTDDLRMMAANFRPAVTPIDYDHLGIEPKRPGDGIAAGWLQTVEVRDDGNTLWGLVEWTDEAAKRIASREYKFVSPSFIKGHTDQTGQKIGTKLVAAALTNFPFLPEMAAVTLNTPAIAAMHLTAQLRDLVAVEDGAVSLSAKPGQRVTVSEQHARNPQHVRATFEVLRVDDAGYDDARVWLKDVTTGETIGWYAASELEPARALNPDPSTTEKSEDPMKPEEKILARAQELASERQISLSAAAKIASREDGAAAREYLAHPEPTAEPSPVINLRRHDGETFAELVTRTAREQRLDLRAATRLVSQSFPALAEGYERDVI